MVGGAAGAGVGLDARVKPGRDESPGGHPIPFVIAGLDPAIHVPVRTGEGWRGSILAGWVYIMTNKRNGTLYTGVTSNLARRAWEHRTGCFEGFTSKYALTLLVLAERHETVPLAIQREKNIKHWPRKWKVALIEESNPGWVDLYGYVAAV